MKLQLLRYHHGVKSTGGLLLADGIHHCFTCEDEHREVKVPGHTRIPKGTYEIKLRDKGTITKKYAKKFDFHRGMLWLQDVPGFEWIYIHVGNTEKHTDGCILVGYGADCQDTNIVRKSVLAYTSLYQMIIEAMDADERVFITIEDMK